MSSPTDRPAGPVAEVVTALLTAHEHLGDEAAALAEASQQTVPAPAQGPSLRRSQSNLTDAATRLVNITEVFLSLHAMEQLGVNGASSCLANGKKITSLPGLDDQEAQLGKGLHYLGSLFTHFDTKVFPEPKRRPDAPLARSPHRTGIALLALRDAALAAGQAAAERKLLEDLKQWAALAVAFEQLEARVCARPVPPLTPERVIAAIQADPAFAAAISQALNDTASVS